MRFLLPSLLLLATGGALLASDAPAWKRSWQDLVQPGETAAEPTELVGATVMPASAQAAAVASPETPAEVKTANTYLTPEEILSALSAALIEQFSLEGELVLLPLTPLTRVKVPDESWRVELVSPFPTSLGSRLHLRYRVTDGHLQEAVRTLSLQVEWWREALVANRQMRGGELFSADAYSVQRINWLLHRGALVDATSDLDVLRLKGVWRAEEPLRWSQVEERPLVQSGKIVEVVAEEGALRISMRGVALNNGNAGDLINVRNLQSRQEIQGIVSNENTVMVVF